MFHVDWEQAQTIRMEWEQTQTQKFHVAHKLDICQIRILYVSYKFHTPNHVRYMSNTEQDLVYPCLMALYETMNRTTMLDTQGIKHKIKGRGRGNCGPLDKGIFYTKNKISNLISHSVSL